MVEAPLGALALPRGDDLAGSGGKTRLLVDPLPTSFVAYADPATGGLRSRFHRPLEFVDGSASARSVRYVWGALSSVGGEGRSQRSSEASVGLKGEPDRWVDGTRRIVARGALPGSGASKSISGEVRRGRESQRYSGRGSRNSTSGPRRQQILEYSSPVVGAGRFASCQIGTSPVREPEEPPPPQRG